MEAIKENKGLIAIAVLLALLVGVSAYNSNKNDETNKQGAETTEQKTADKKADDKKVAASQDEKKADDTASDKSNPKQDTDKSDEDAKQKEEDSAEDTNDTYAYTAQPGDSYSVLARKAVQTYGLVNNVKLSLAEILAAEAKLTTDASAEYLNEAQSVNISQSDVKAAIDHAQGLSDDEEAAWAEYVPYVDFDTRKNGEK